MPNTYEQLPELNKGCIGEYSNIHYNTYNYHIYPCTKKLELFTINKEKYFYEPKYSAYYNYEKLFFPEQTKINELKQKGAKGFYFLALVNGIIMKFKLDEGSTNTSIGINYAKRLGLEKIITKPAIAEAVGSEVKILGKTVVDIKINEYLTKNLKIDILNTESKYILLSNKHQLQIGILKDQKNHTILINNKPILNQRVLIQQLKQPKNGHGNAQRLLLNLSKVYSEDKPSFKYPSITIELSQDQRPVRSFLKPAKMSKVRKDARCPIK